MVATLSEARALAMLGARLADADILEDLRPVGLAIFAAHSHFCSTRMLPLGS